MVSFPREKSALYTPLCNMGPTSHEGFEVWFHSLVRCLYTHLFVIWVQLLTRYFKYEFIPSWGASIHTSLLYGSDFSRRISSLVLFPRESPIHTPFKRYSPYPENKFIWIHIFRHLILVMRIHDQNIPTWSDEITTAQVRIDWSYLSRPLTGLFAITLVAVFYEVTEFNGGGFRGQGVGPFPTLYYFPHRKNLSVSPDFPSPYIG